MHGFAFRSAGSRPVAFLPALLAGCLAGSVGAQPAPAIPAAFAVEGRPAILTVVGVGAQIYECKPDATGSRAWAFREPIAALMQNGATVGRHYAGPNWDVTDGGGVSGKLMASQPGATADDIPLLELQVTAHRGTGALQEAGLILRLNTVGGVLKGPCDQTGDLRSVPYRADYVFMK